MDERPEGPTAGNYDPDDTFWVTDPTSGNAAPAGGPSDAVDAGGRVPPEIVGRVGAVERRLAEIEILLSDAGPLARQLASIAELVQSTRPPELASMLDSFGGLRSELAFLGTRLEDTIRDHAADLTPIRAALDSFGGAADYRQALADVWDAITLLREQHQAAAASLSTRDELREVVAELTRLSDLTRDDLHPLRVGLSDVLEALADQLSTERSDSGTLERLLEEIRVDLAALRPEAGPVMDRLEQLAAHIDAQAPDLTTVTAAIIELRTHLDDRQPDFPGLRDAIAALEARIEAARPDLTPVLSMIARLSETVESTRLGQAPLDLTPIEQRLGALSAAIEGSRPDLAGLDTAIAAIGTTLHDLGSEIVQLSASPADLGSALEVLRELQSTVEAMQNDTRPLRAGLDHLESRLDTIALQSTESTERLLAALPGLDIDLTPVQALADEVRSQGAAQDDRLARLQAQLDTVGALVRDSGPDLGPLEDRLTALTSMVEASRPDLGEIVSAITELTQLNESVRGEFGPLHAGLSDVLEAMAQQLSVDQTAADSIQAGLDQLDTRLHELTAHIGRTAPDLEPVLHLLRDLPVATSNTERLLAALPGLDIDLTPVQALADALRSQAASHDDRLTRLQAQLDALGTMVRDARPDLTPLELQLTALASDVEASRPDLNQITGSIAELLEVNELARRELGPLHAGLSDVLEAMAQQLLVDRTAADSVQAGLDQLGARLDQLAAQIDQAAPDLEPVLNLLRDLPVATSNTERILAALPDLDIDLTPVQAVADEVRNQTATHHERLADLQAQLDALGTLVQTTRPDLGPLELQLEQLGTALHLIEQSTALAGPALDRTSTELLARIDAHADTHATDVAGLDARLAHASEQWQGIAGQIRALDGRLDQLTDHLDEATPDLRPLAEAVDAVQQETRDGRADVASLAESLRALADRVEAVDRRMATVDAVDELRGQLTDTEQRLAAGAGAIPEAEDRLARQIEVAADALGRQLAEAEQNLAARADAARTIESTLGRRVDVASDDLRGRIDTQRVVTEALSAQVSSLNAALIEASAAPQQLRRDIDRVVDGLSDRLGSALRELRAAIHDNDESLAVRTTVEAGLERLGERLQQDAASIMETVVTAQDDTGERLRRIDVQVTELRRAIELARRVPGAGATERES